MSTAETRPQGLAALPDDASDRTAATPHMPADKPAEPESKALDWLLGCVVDGLLHCACTHHAVHPDLIDCIARQAHGHAAEQDHPS